MIPALNLLELRLSFSLRLRLMMDFFFFRFRGCRSLRGFYRGALKYMRVKTYIDACYYLSKSSSFRLPKGQFWFCHQKWNNSSVIPLILLFISAVSSLQGWMLLREAELSFWSQFTPKFMHIIAENTLEMINDTQTLVSVNYKNL
jgi:hypothetical protein